MINTDRISYILEESVSVIWISTTDRGWSGVFKSMADPKRLFQITFDQGFLTYKIEMYYESKAPLEFSEINGWVHREKQEELPVDV